LLFLLLFLLRRPHSKADQHWPLARQLSCGLAAATGARAATVACNRRPNWQAAWRLPLARKWKRPRSCSNWATVPADTNHLHVLVAAAFLSLPVGLCTLPQPHTAATHCCHFSGQRGRPASERTAKAALWPSSWPTEQLGGAPRTKWAPCIWARQGGQLCVHAPPADSLWAARHNSIRFLSPLEGGREN